MWINGWEMQCCGDPFRVGDRAEFTTTTDVDREFLSAVVGGERAVALTDCEDRHGLVRGSMSTVAGTVLSIEAVSCRYELRKGAMYPVPGTTRLAWRDEATGWEPEVAEVRFVGYVVRVRAN